VVRFCSNLLITRRKIDRMEAMPTALTALQEPPRQPSPMRQCPDGGRGRQAELARLTAIASAPGR
jgi:hypothetical protein